MFQSRLSIVIVNRKPVVPGHLLVIPKALVPRMQGLNVDQVQDLFLAVQAAQKLVEAYFEVTSSTISIQDGPEAGQTVIGADAIQIYKFATFRQNRKRRIKMKNVFY